IPGYTALPITARTGFQSPVGLTLSSQQFGSPGARIFRVVTPPANGTLNATVGAAIASASVTYTPKPGFSGIDSFEYVAEDSTSSYPRNPRAAATTIQVGPNPSPGGPTVAVSAISGAPAALIVGTSAQLSASVLNGSRGVAWSVNGVAGGNATAGTITSGGLYVAPASVPRGGKVTVRATSIDDPSEFAEKSITIVPRPDSKPKPGAKHAISEPRVVVTKGRTILTTQAKVAGSFTVVARYLRPGKKARVIGRCKAARKAGRTLRCTLRYSKKLNRKYIQLVVTFRPKSGQRVMRRVGPTKLGALRFAVAKRGALKGRRVTVRTKTLRTGRVVMVLRHRNKVVRRCVVSRLAGQVATCRVTLGRRQSAKNLRATATLRSEDGLRVTTRGRP
ncbi:MAG: Ig-like domain-containing protein, partial [Thermoleophilia bacterium]|nr:Ig-like domain-containing protein [Thermoleophilia bacterium]